MARPFVLVLFLALSACVSEPAIIACEGERPQVCTMQYEPTCAVMTSGEEKQYSSPCNACADDQVAGYKPGPCPE